MRSALAAAAGRGSKRAGDAPEPWRRGGVGYVGNVVAMPGGVLSPLSQCGRGLNMSQLWNTPLYTWDFRGYEL